MIEIKPRLAEHGKIKIGKLGEERKTRDGSGTYRLPTKIDHFIITSTERDNTGNFTPNVSLMKSVGLLVNQPPNHLTKIPVYLLFDDIDSNFYTTFNCYRGKTLVCQGDGKTAIKTETGEEVSCPCPMLDKDYAGKTPCKPYGRLSVIIQDMDIVGSVWVYRTTGWNSVQDLLGSLLLVKRIAGRLSGIRLILKLMPKSVQLKHGPATIYTASLIFEGSVPALAEAAKNLPMLAYDETMTPDQTISETEEAEIAEEFFTPKEESPTIPKAETPQGKTESPTVADLAKKTADQLKANSKKALEQYLAELGKIDSVELINSWKTAEKRSEQLNLEDSMELKKAIYDRKAELITAPPSPTITLPSFDVEDKAENEEELTQEETKPQQSVEEENYEKFSAEIKALTSSAEFDEWATSNKKTLPDQVTAQQKKALLSLWKRLKNKALKLEEQKIDQEEGPQVEKNPPTEEGPPLAEDLEPEENSDFGWI